MKEYKCNTPYFQRIHKRRQGQSSEDNKRELELIDEYKSEYSNIYDSYGVIQNYKLVLFCQLLSELNILYDRDVTIGQYTYDLKVRNTLIKFVDTITENAQFALDKPEEDIEPYINLFRFDNAQANGYECIHIFDWDDFDKIAIALQSKQLKDSNDIVIDKINKTECELFLHCNSYIYPHKYRYFTYAYGGFIDNDLVAVLMVRKCPGIKYDWELLGYVEDVEFEYDCFDKLLSAFKEDICPSNMVAYVDKSKNSGSELLRYGFMPVYDRWPARVWSKGIEKITQNDYSQKPASKLVDVYNDIYGKYINMLENRWLPVFDCGTRTYEWRAK